MDTLTAVDWQGMFRPEHSVLEMILRGTIMYLGLFLLLRFFGRRPAGSMTTADLLMIVLLADAAQNAMSADYTSITDGAILVATIVGWDYALDWLAFRSKRIARLLRPPPLALIRNGALQRKNMRQEMITTEELMSQLRETGVETFAEVKLAQLEGDGRVSVIKLEKSHDQPKRRDSLRT